MKRLFIACILVFFLAATSYGQGQTSNFSTPWGSTITTLSATSGTVLTANTMRADTLICTNTTASAATLSVTDTAGNVFVSALSIAAHDVKVVWDSVAGLVMTGVKWWSGTASALNCYMGGRQ